MSFFWRFHRMKRYIDTLIQLSCTIQVTCKSTVHRGNFISNPMGILRSIPKQHSHLNSGFTMVSLLPCVRSWWITLLNLLKSWCSKGARHGSTSRKRTVLVCQKRITAKMTGNLCWNVHALHTSYILICMWNLDQSMVSEVYRYIPKTSRKWAAAHSAAFLFEFWFTKILWSSYSDLTRPHPKWWFSTGNHLISGKSRLVKYYNLARSLVDFLII